MSAVYLVTLVNVTLSRNGRRAGRRILGPRLYGRNPDPCCYLRKVEPLERALKGYDAWITGVRREEIAVAAIDARRRVRREAAEGQGQPDRGLDVGAGRRVHRVQRRAREPARLRGLPVDRLPDLHDARRAGRGPALWPVGRDRQDRVRHPRLTPLVAVAHGSRDPRAAATVTELLSVVRARAPRRGLPGLEVRAAFLDHCAPSLPCCGYSGLQRRTGGPSVVVPLLLTAAYHSKADIPAQLAAAAAALVPALTSSPRGRSARTRCCSPPCTGGCCLRRAWPSATPGPAPRPAWCSPRAGPVRPSRQRDDRGARGAVGARAGPAGGRARLRIGGRAAACRGGARVA